MKFKPYWVLVIIVICFLAYIYAGIRNITFVEVEEPVKISFFTQNEKKFALRLSHNDGSIPEEVIVDFMNANDETLFASDSVKPILSESGVQYFKFEIPKQSFFRITPTMIKIRLR